MIVRISRDRRTIVAMWGGVREKAPHTMKVITKAAMTKGQ
jgi:hypothetical protein